MPKITSSAINTNGSISNGRDTNGTFLTRCGYNHSIHEINEFKLVIERDANIGMNVPVKIYANETLISSMISDRTIQHAVNVSTLPGVTKHVVVLPDGHEFIIIILCHSPYKIP